MSREAILWLRDIEDRCERILGYTSGMTLDAFLADARTQDAIERNFQVIGDAAKALPESVYETAPEVPWSMLARFRDVVTHSYFRVDAVEVWNTIDSEIPDLLAAVRRMIVLTEDPSSPA